MIKRIMAVSVVSLALVGSVFAGGGFEPAVTVVERPAEKKAEPTSVVPVAVPLIAIRPDVKEHALFVGTYGINVSTEVDGDDSVIDDVKNFVSDREWDRAGYVKYSPVVNGGSPVLQVAFGDLKGFGLGVGYGFADRAKVYGTLNTYDAEEYFPSGVDVGGELGLHIALPVGLAVDLGVATQELDRIGKSGAEAIPFVGVGFRW